MGDGASATRGSDAATLVRGVGVLIPGRFAGRAIAYAVQVALARLLGPVGYGQFAIGWKILLIGGLFAALGLDNAVIRFGASYLREQVESLHALVRRSLGVSLAGGLAVGALLAVSSRFLAERVYHQSDLREVLLVFALGLVVLPLLRVGAAATRVWQTMRYSVLAEDLAQPVVQLLLVLAFHRLAWGVLGAALATVSSFFLALLLVMRYLHTLAPRLWRSRTKETRSTRELIAFALPTALAGGLSLTAVSVDLLLVGYFRSGAETGYYQAAVQISLLFAVVLTSFNVAFSPMIADLYHRGEHDRLQELFRISTRWGLLVALPLFVAIAVHPSGVLTLLMGPRYAAGGTALLILAGGQMINLATGAVGHLLVMSGRQTRWLVASAGAVATNIALNLVLIPRFGLEGAATATAISLLALFGSGLVMVRREMDLWPYDRTFVRVALAVLPAAAAVFSVGRLGIAAGPLRAVLELLISGVVFWATAGVLGRRALADLLAMLSRRDGG